MSDQGHDRLADLFRRAVSLDDAERDEFLARECADDAERRALESLLGHDEAGLFPETDEDADPESIGRYRILERIGAGGMGIVYLAEQTEPAKLRVAVKVIKRGMDTRNVIRRFWAERRMLAALSHDGIAKIFDAGSTEDGRPFFAMEYVEGRPITAFCDAENLDLAARLGLFLDVCAAVQHAHQHAIIHRDLKPSNVMVSGSAGQPVVKVIDFGLAKALDRDFEVGSMPSEGRIIGTPEYMSPEQAVSGMAVDTRSDVFSLGIMLHELLAGVLPTSAVALRNVPALALGAAIRDRQAEKPSSGVRWQGDAADAIAGARCLASAKKLEQTLRGDLDAITVQATQNEAERRYSGAAELANDIESYLQGLPVRAVRPTRRYVVGKFVRRHRVALAVAVVLAGSTVAMIEAWGRERGARDMRDLYQRTGDLGVLDQRELTSPPPARKSGIPRMLAWQDEIEALLSHRASMASYAEEELDESDHLYRLLQKFFKRADDMTGPVGRLTWVRKRIAWARVVAQRTVVDHRDAWERARQDVAADSRFVGFELHPQVGLVPLGPDPVTNLQEFAFLLPDGELPQRQDGKFTIGPRTCPVFVLLPGGRFIVGCQSKNAGGKRYDPYREPSDIDPGRCVLAPFFASKYELTHGQWLLVTGDNIAQKVTHPISRIDLTHPLMNVGDFALGHALVAWGMRLPTSAEWGYLARGNTNSPWWCGDSFRSLEGNENVADRALLRDDVETDDPWVVPWSDKWARTSPVGTFRPNGFGLFDVLGNVCELSESESGNSTDARAGSWHMGWRAARVAARLNWLGTAKPTIGCRPALTHTHP